MTSLRRVSCGVLASLAVLLLLASWAGAQDVSRIFGEEASEQQGPPIRPVRTDSPRDTLTTFLRLRNELEAAVLDYNASRSSDGHNQITLLFDQLRALINLEAVASASRCYSTSSAGSHCRR